MCLCVGVGVCSVCRISYVRTSHQSYTKIIDKSKRSALHTYTIVGSGAVH